MEKLPGPNLTFGPDTFEPRKGGETIMPLKESYDLMLNKLEAERKRASNLRLLVELLVDEMKSANVNQSTEPTPCLFCRRDPHDHDCPLIVAPEALDQAKEKA